MIDRLYAELYFLSLIPEDVFMAANTKLDLQRLARLQAAYDLVEKERKKYMCKLALKQPFLVRLYNMKGLFY